MSKEMAATCWVLGGILAGIAITAFVLSIVNQVQNKNDDDGDVDYDTLTLHGHWDNTLNESFTARFKKDDGGVVFAEFTAWNGTCISTGGSYLTSNFTIPDRYLPNYNETSNAPFITPVAFVRTFAGTYRSLGYGGVDPNGKFALWRDGTNSTSAWAFDNLQCQHYSFSLQWDSLKVTFN